MQYIIFWWLMFISLVFAKPILQKLKENELDQTDLTSQLLEANTLNQVDFTSHNAMKENDMSENSNIFRRLSNACPVTVSNKKKNSIQENSATTHSDDVCDDPAFKILVSCGGVVVIPRYVQSIEVEKWVLNCEAGKFFFFHDSNNLEID